VNRVTLDSNEWISAFNFRGRSLGLIHSAISGDIEIAISEPIIAETIRVLRQDFDWQPYRLFDLRQCAAQPQNCLAGKLGRSAE